MGDRRPPRSRHALFAFVVVLLAASVLTNLPGARAATPNYQITGQVLQPNGFGIPSNFTVQLISGGTHAVYTTKTGAKGSFTFDAANTNGTLAPGWWGLDVQPQGSVQSSTCPPGGLGECAVIPANSTPQYEFESATLLTTTNSRLITGVTVVGFSTNVTARVLLAGNVVAGATVEVISPRVPGIALSENTTNKTGYTTFEAPAGNWLLYTVAPGSPSQFNYTNVTIPSSGVFPQTINIGNYLVYGSISSTAGGLVSNGFNATLIDTTAGRSYATYSQYDSVGYSYAVGSYPSNFVGPGTETFDLVVAPIGYAPGFISLSVSPSDPSGVSSVPHNIDVNPIAPPAVYNTTLNFASGPTGASFGLLNVTTVETIGNYSVLPELQNASVGQLWAQLALDFDHDLTIPGATVSGAVLPWLEDQGPFFPAGQNQATINGTGFGQPTNYTAVASVTGTALSSYGLTSPNGLSVVNYQNYNVTAALPKSGTGPKYTISFQFRHPTNEQSINYTVVLPKGYALQADTAAPANSKLVPAGPDNTWTKFYLDSLPSSSAYGTASFTVVKYGNISARVNVTAQSFTFSSKNVLNVSRTNYTVVVGVGQNTTFSALNTTYPAGTNGSLFRWNFGDSSPLNVTSQPTTYHTYTGAGKYSATLNVTSSGGLTNQITFTVYVGSEPPTAVIDGNWTAAQNQSVGGHQYLIVNWSTPIQFNITGSTAPLYPGAPVQGVISTAVWNVSSYNYSSVTNYSWSAGANSSTPFTYSFLGAGHYLLNGTGAFVSVPFKGWQYNVTLTIWNGQGQESNISLTVLVRDTEKPVASIEVLNANYQPVPSAGVTEGSNGTVLLRLTGRNSSDPHNGTIAAYGWVVSNSGNSSFVNLTFATEAQSFWFRPQNDSYLLNLTVTDLAGNKNYTTYSLTVAYNKTIRPILTVTNLTVEASTSSLTTGTTYTAWVNVTNTGGSLSKAEAVSVLFSLSVQSSSTTGKPIAGTPASVVFYNVTNGAVNTSAPISGPIRLAYNQTVRAQIRWTPARLGNLWLWVNASCANQYAAQGPNLAHVAVTIGQNPVVEAEQYGAIAAAAIIVIVALVWIYRRRRRAANAPRGGGRLERGGAKKSSDEDEDDADGDESDSKT